MLVLTKGKLMRGKWKTAPYLNQTEAQLPDHGIQVRKSHTGKQLSKRHLEERTTLTLYEFSTDEKCWIDLVGFNNTT